MFIAHFTNISKVNHVYYMLYINPPPKAQKEKESLFARSSFTSYYTNYPPFMWSFNTIVYTSSLKSIAPILHKSNALELKYIVGTRQR